MTINDFFEPKSIAIIGASGTSGKVGYTVLKNIKNSFEGEIYPINPENEEILDLKTYPSINDIENQIDLAIIAIPAKTVKEELNNCIQKKVKAVIILSGGFSEIGKKELEKELKDTIKGKKIRILGPNCSGILIPKRLNTLFLSEKRIKTPNEGSISLISQSGSVGTTIIDLFALKGIGLAKFVSYGNTLDVNELDLIEYLGNDLTTRCISIYLESIENGVKFIELAKKTSKTKPIIILKAGKTEKGKEAVLNHIGKESGSGKLYSTAFKQANIIEANSIEELLDYSKTFANQPIPKTNKIAIITDSGGFGVLAADECSKNNLELIEFQKETITALKKLLPDYAIKANPLDMGNDIGSEKLQQVLELVIKEKVDTILLLLSFRNPKFEDIVINTLQDMKVYGKTLLVCSAGSEYTIERIRKLENYGIPVFPTPKRAINSLKVLMNYGSKFKKRK